MGIEVHVVDGGALLNDLQVLIQADEFEKAAKIIFDLPEHVGPIMFNVLRDHIPKEKATEVAKLIAGMAGIDVEDPCATCPSPCELKDVDEKATDIHEQHPTMQ